MKFRDALAVVFVLAMCGVCVRLGFWQLDRLEQRRARNHALEVAARMPVLGYDSMTAEAIEREPALFINRHLRATGSYDPMIRYFHEVIPAGVLKGGNNTFKFKSSSDDYTYLELSDIVVWWQANI